MVLQECGRSGRWLWADCKAWWSLVGAVPVCPPVSPCKGASIVHPRVQCVYFWYGNAAARTFGRARRHRPYHSKHTSPFYKDENKNFNARSRTARLKTKNLALAVELQGSKQKIWCSQSNCTAQNKKFGARSSTARLKTKNLVLAVTLQAIKRKKQCSQ